MARTSAHSRAQACATFWLDAGESAWFEQDDAFDSAFRARFLDDHHAAARREHDDWLDHPEGAFALMILLDQFPRNCFRGTGHMYATDPLARHLARRAIEARHDQRFNQRGRVFFYLPFAHSELLADQEYSMQLHRQIGGEYLKHAIGHHDIVARFGHFPHRNRILGRETTPDRKSVV